jgi:hypothetical protein
MPCLSRVNKQRGAALDFQNEAHANVPGLVARESFQERTKASEGPRHT